MPEKQKTHTWTKTQTTIASGAMLGLLALFNVIASFDRHKVNGNPGGAPSLSATPTIVVEAMLGKPGLTPVATNSVTRTRSS